VAILAPLQDEPVFEQALDMILLLLQVPVLKLQYTLKKVIGNSCFMVFPDARA